MSRMPRTAWVVVFTEPGYPTAPELEVFPNRAAARRQMREGLDPGWYSALYRVYLDECHATASAPALPVDEESA